MRHCLVRRREVGASDRVVDDVGAMPGGFVADYGGQIFARSIDHANLTVRLDKWFRPSRYAEHARAVHRRDLRRCLADHAVDRCHQYDITRFGHAGALETLERSDERHAE